MNRPVKKVRVIEANKTAEESIKEKYLQKRVAAYCRVSTQQEEQLNSYAVQVKHYTDRINSEPKWKLVGIYADKGISGTSTKNRDEFNKMIRMCKRGKIDMIITKSISRFARNTVDCLKYIRLLKDFGVDVFFEEQGIHSMSNGTEFYITVYGSLAQSESENISANVRWGKEQSAKEGNIQFRYKNTLGYKKGIDGNPEIVPEEAEIIKYIYRLLYMQLFFPEPLLRQLLPALIKTRVFLHVFPVQPDLPALRSRCDGSDLRDEVFRGMVTRAGNTQTQVIGGVRRVQGKAVRVQIPGRDLQHRVGFSERGSDIL